MWLYCHQQTSQILCGEWCGRCGYVENGVDMFKPTLYRLRDVKVFTGGGGVGGGVFQGHFVE